MARYAALRAGARLHTGPVSLSLVTDVADFDDAAADGGDRLATGFAALGELSGDHWFIETSAGVAPWIPRAEGLGRAALWLRSGRRW